MTQSPEDEVVALTDQLLRWSRAYFEDDAPLVPDADYDAAMGRLQALGERLYQSVARRCC